MGGQRVDDHNFWAGKREEGSVFPMGSKNRMMDNVDGAGELNRYEDTEGAIREFQDKNRQKAKSLPMKPGYRN